jgi:calcium-dependent protein kinase
VLTQINNGAINYTEFIAATLDNLIVNNATRIEKAFKIFDKDGDGTISENELEQVLSGESGQFIDRKIFTEIISECDLNEDGKVDFQEFQKCMTKEYT